MADALSVAASVAGLVTIADSIVRKGFKYIKDVKEAENSVHRLVEEVNNLSGVLHSLKNVAERLDEDKHPVDSTTRVHFIQSCYESLKKVEATLDNAVPVEPLTRGKKFLWPLKTSHISELLHEIERQKSTMILALSARHMDAFMALLDQQESIETKLRDIKIVLDTDRVERRIAALSKERQLDLNFLGEIDPWEWQDANIRRRQPGTGIWFTDGADFHHWLAADQSKLWINGIPGAGKTILISSIIQEIQTQIEGPHALAFFYCDHRSPETHDASNILGALAKQLVLQDERGFSFLEDFNQSHIMRSGSLRKHPPEKLCEFIKKLSTHFESTMIVVDGLDEITNNRATVTRLLCSLNTGALHVKTLFASRPEVDIGHELVDHVRVGIAAKSSDLLLYVASELELRTKDRRLRIQDPSLKDVILKTLVDGADGMFRWVACQMDYLGECNNDRDRRDALTKLPPDLPSSYERILERVNRSSKENQDLVMKTLHWIAYAETADGEFTTEHLLQALAIRHGETDFHRSSMTTEEEILHWCSSLVRKNKSLTGLELSHFTVKEFLLAIDSDQNSCFFKYRLSGDHTLLAKACLDSLCYRSFNGSPRPEVRSKDKTQTLKKRWNDFGEKYVFVRYSWFNWSHHVHNTHWEDVQQQALEIFNIEETLEFWTIGWLCHFQNRSTFDSKYVNFVDYFRKPYSPTRLHWAAILALDKLCACFINEGMNVSQLSCMGPPLYCAILSHHAIYNNPEGKGWYARMHKSWRQSARKTVVRQLVEAGADSKMAADAEGRVTIQALTTALAIEAIDGTAPFLVPALIEGGARLSIEDFGTLRHEIHRLEKNQCRLRSHELCLFGTTLSSVIKASTQPNRKGLFPGADLEFFSLLLDIVSRGWSIECLHEFFEINFSKFLAEPIGDELDIIIRDESRDRRSRLIIILSIAILEYAVSTSQAKSIFAQSLYESLWHKQVWVIILLLNHNDYFFFSFMGRTSWRAGGSFDWSHDNYDLAQRLVRSLEHSAEEGARQTAMLLFRAGDGQVTMDPNDPAMYHSLILQLRVVYVLLATSWLASRSQLVAVLETELLPLEDEYGLD